MHRAVFRPEDDRQANALVVCKECESKELPFELIAWDRDAKLQRVAIHRGDCFAVGNHIAEQIRGAFFDDDVLDLDAVCTKGFEFSHRFYAQGAVVR